MTGEVDNMETNGLDQETVQVNQLGLVTVSNQAQKRKDRVEGDESEVDNLNKKTYVGGTGSGTVQPSEEDIALAEKQVSEFLARHIEMKRSLNAVQLTLADQKLVMQK
jgi:hypothetical protein